MLHLRRRLLYSLVSTAGEQWDPANTITGFSKWLPTPRRLPAPDSTKYKKDSKVVTELLAENLIAMLRRYSMARQYDWTGARTELT